MESGVYSEFRRRQDIGIFTYAYQNESEIKSWYGGDRTIDFGPEYIRTEQYEQKLDEDVVEPYITFEKTSNSFALYYPRLTNTPINLRAYFDHWQRFLPVAMRGNGNTAATLIIDGVRRAIPNRDRLRQLCVTSLWRSRWICSDEVCAQIYVNLLADTEQELRDILLTGEEASEAFYQVHDQLILSKRNVSSLDEWFEEIYQLLPLCYYTQMLLKASSLDEKQKMLRFVDEAMADMLGVLVDMLLICVFMSYKHYMSHNYLVSPFFSSNGDFNSFKRNMTYRCNSRVTYPSYWLNLALSTAAQMVYESDIPELLDNFSELRLISSSITLNPQRAFLMFGEYNSLGRQYDRLNPSLESAGKLAYEISFEVLKKLAPNVRILGTDHEFPDAQ